MTDLILQAGLIRRRFVDLPVGQTHLRVGGEGGPRPLVMLHASPGSGAQLQALAERLATSRRVIAPDTPGFGDSTPLALAEPDAADYAKALIETLDALELDQVDLYGSHTGAAIALEAAILAPGRVRRLVLDGIGLFSPEEQAAHLASYAPRIVPDLNGAYLQTAFMFLRDQFVYWPWYGRSAAHVHGGELPAPGVLHAWLVEFLKALGTYHLGYRAAFAHPMADRLPLAAQPTLAMAQAGDPLEPHTEAAARLLRNGRYQHSERAAAAATIAAFLDS